MIAALETLTFDEVHRAMQRSFELNSFSSKEKLSHSGLIEVLTSYFIIEMLEGDSGDVQQHLTDKENVLDLYPHWNITFEFLLDVAANDRFQHQPIANPFKE